MKKKYKKCRVLVTGVGGGVGQAILKALRLCKIRKTIFAADVSPLSAGLFCSDESVLLPKVETVGALQEIIKILSRKKINLLLPGSEFDLMFFALHKKTIENATKTKIIIATPKTVEIANDKWLTVEFLRTNKLPYPESFLPSNISEAMAVLKSWGYPVILKSRTGTSSRHVHFIRSAVDLKLHYSNTPNAMLQKVIQQPTNELGNEYTCSVFKSLDGKIQGPFIARRTLRGGTSWHIEVKKFPKIRRVLVKIGEKLDYFGPLNIQLMMTKSGPIPFEINARFSGTTAVRAFFGFNEPKMCIQELFLGEKIETPFIRSGVALRYHEEVFLPGVQATRLKLGKHKGHRISW